MYNTDAIIFSHIKKCFSYVKNSTLSYVYNLKALVFHKSKAIFRISSAFPSACARWVTFLTHRLSRGFSSHSTTPGDDRRRAPNTSWSPASFTYGALSLESIESRSTHLPECDQSCVWTNSHLLRGNFSKTILIDSCFRLFWFKPLCNQWQRKMDFKFLLNFFSGGKCLV